jgi:putative flippase GtrA
MSHLFLIARYIFSGFLSFSTNLGFLYIFKNYFHMWYLLASTLAFIIAVLVSFVAQKFITFKDGSKEGMHKQFWMYAGICTFNVFANAGMMYFLVDVWNVQYMVAQVASAFIIAVYSLFAYRFLIFSHVKIL